VLQGLVTEPLKWFEHAHAPKHKQNDYSVIRDEKSESVKKNFGLTLPPLQVGSQTSATIRPSGVALMLRLLRAAEAFR
jgi:hypothetical protein